MPDIIVEDGASIRAVKRVYGELTGNPNHGLEPKDLAEVCEGKRPGDKEAAIKAFDKMGEVAGDAMATAVTLIDGLIVIGGGVMNNYKYLMPGILRTMRGKMHQLTGGLRPSEARRRDAFQDRSQQGHLARSLCVRIDRAG